MGHETIKKSARPRMGRPKGPRLTETDINVIRLIAKEGFQTHGELRSEILQNYNRTHSWDLMKRLVQMGWLRESLGDRNRILGWSLSPKAQTDLQNLFEKSWHADRRPPTYRSSFNHDVTLREVKKLLCESPCISDWIGEHVLKAEIMSKIKFLGARDRGAKLLSVPDAKFQLRNTGRVFMAALELELTRKSKRRIFQKLESHITSPEFDFVFFIAGEEKLQQLLHEIYGQVMNNSARVKFKKQQNGIYFTTLQNLRKQKLETPFVGIKDSINFAKLKP